MDKIIEILKEIVPNVNPAEETQLVEKKILNSFNLIKLVVALNEEFDIEITPMDLIPENFNSASAIYKMVQRLEEE